MIPYPKSEITPLRIRSAVIREFFYPVLTGRLEVMVEHGGECHRINQDSIIAEALDIPWEKQNIESDRVFDQIDFADRSRRVGEYPDAELACAGEDGAPQWSEALFSEVDLEELQEKWQEGEVVSIRAPILVKAEDEDNVVSEFMMYFQKDDKLSSGESRFVRGGLIVPDAGKGVPGGVRAMAVIEAVDLTALLGDAENPAHRRWNERSDELKRHYRHGPTTVRFVNQSLNYVSQHIIPKPEGLDEELLSDIFYIEELRGEQEDEREETDEPEIEVESDSKPLRLSRRAGGFRVASNPGYEGTVLGGVVRAAYDVARGNPFSKYREWDFEFSEDDLTIEAEGCAIQNANDNKLAFSVTGPEFSIVATGFDVNRDLIVEVTPKMPEEE